MKIIFSLTLTLIAICSFSQDSPTRFTYKSSIARIEEYNISTSKWDKKDYTVSSLVVVDLKTKKIITYNTKKDNDLDIITALDKEVKGTSVTYSWKCLDTKNEECVVVLSYLDSKALFMRIDYTLYRLSYFFN